MSTVATSTTPVMAAKNSPVTMSAIADELHLNTNLKNSSMTDTSIKSVNNNITDLYDWYVCEK